MNINFSLLAKVDDSGIKEFEFEISVGKAADLAYYVFLKYVKGCWASFWNKKYVKGHKILQNQPLIFDAI